MKFAKILAVAMLLVPTVAGAQPVPPVAPGVAGAAPGAAAGGAGAAGGLGAAGAAGAAGGLGALGALGATNLLLGVLPFAVGITAFSTVLGEENITPAPAAPSTPTTGTN
jgi:hypothetical protein